MPVALRSERSEVKIPPFLQSIFISRSSSSLVFFFFILRYNYYFSFTVETMGLWRMGKGEGGVKIG